KKLRAKLNGQINSGIDPEILRSAPNLQRSISRPAHAGLQTSRVPSQRIWTPALKSFARSFAHGITALAT
ncbi:hypothetical protein, partial [Brucella abortus]|uniref:hypothetical protein n=1 Tax=Brucella abortus TaxID=235 RepID=UPI00283AB85A